MTSRRPVDPAPGPLETYGQQFDALFGKSNQRESFRRYLAGLLLPQERNKTLTALANTAPVVGAPQPPAQTVPWFLSESCWDPQTLTRRRSEVLGAAPLTAPQGQGVLVIDEHGDRKWGTKTAHVGRQYLGNLGKTDNGVVSVTRLWADEGVYYPLQVEPYTPAPHFARGKADPRVRPKRQIAADLGHRARAAGIPYRAVVAATFYGADEALRTQGRGYVLALPPSHGWWPLEGTIGSLQEAVAAAPGDGSAAPGAWVAVERSFRDGPTETWWVREVAAGPYGPEKLQRGLVATTDPRTLPPLTTWYLVTNLPAPRAPQAAHSSLAVADVAESVRLYGLRPWVEQSYTQSKSALGGPASQGRSDVAIRRHCALVCCAFCCCWYNLSQQCPALAPAPGEGASRPPSAAPSPVPAPAALQTDAAGRGKNLRDVGAGAAAALLAGGAAHGPRVGGAWDHAVALLARLVACAPTRVSGRVA
jgi:DDE superfamily endonuclease